MGVLETLLTPRSKAATGVGVAMATHGVPLLSASESPERRAATALAAYRASPYIRSAERAIANRIAALPWWLETGEGEHIGDDSPEPYRAIRDLVEQPYRPAKGDPVTATPRTRSGLWQLLTRHMGLVGYGLAYLAGTEALAGTPAEILAVHPARLTPATNDEGQLIGWVLDKGTHPVPFTVDEIVLFALEPPDGGHLPTGLVQTAMAKAEVARLGDQHAAYILASGGRMPGIYHPPTGATIPEESFESLVRDLRSVVEMPDAAKRSLVLRGPVEFDATAQGPAEMQLLEVMAMSRDDIFALWGVPRSQLGYERKFSLGGTADDMDAEVMWHGAIAPRLAAFAETFQSRILDRYAALGLPVTLRFDEPTFDDDSPKYVMAAQAASVPLRNVERRAILGLPPIGDPAIDDAILLPINVVPLYQAPPLTEGEMMGMAKADLADRRVSSLMRALARFLEEQRERIAAKLERNSAHVARKPSDESAWWKESEEDAALLAVLRPHVVDAAVGAGERARSRVTGKAGEDEVWRDVFGRLTLDRLARRVTGINRTTRERIRDLVAQALEVGMSPAELARYGLRDVVPPLAGDTAAWEPVLRGAKTSFASELRAETIARTEMRIAQNAAALDSYRTLGVERVEMIDGHEDAECAARDGRIVSMAEAEMHMDAEHPNGTLDLAPVIG